MNKKLPYVCNLVFLNFVSLLAASLMRERCAELTDVEQRLVEAFPQHHALHPLREVRHLGQLHQELFGLIQRNYNRI